MWYILTGEGQRDIMVYSALIFFFFKFVDESFSKMEMGGHCVVCVKLWRQGIEGRPVGRLHS